MPDRIIERKYDTTDGYTATAAVLVSEQVWDDPAFSKQFIASQWAALESRNPKVIPDSYTESVKTVGDVQPEEAVNHDERRQRIASAYLTFEG